MAKLLTASVAPGAKRALLATLLASKSPPGQCFDLAHLIQLSNSAANGEIRK